MKGLRHKKYPIVIIIVFVFLLTIAFEILYAQGKSNNPQSPAKPIPRLVDVGADKCIPCIMMAPILEELKKEYAGVLIVEFVDVWKNPDAGRRYGIRAIPTQIFYDASGKELYRHMGFMSKEAILKTFKSLGIDLKPSSPQKKKG